MVFLLTLFVPITLTFFHTFLTKRPRTDAPIHRESEKGSSRKPSFRQIMFSETGLPVLDVALYYYQPLHTPWGVSPPPSLKKQSQTRNEGDKEDDSGQGKEYDGVQG